MQLIQPAQNKQTKTNQCVYMSFQVIVFHYKQCTHKQRNKPTNAKPKEKKKQTMCDQRKYTKIKKSACDDK